MPKRDRIQRRALARLRRADAGARWNVSLPVGYAVAEAQVGGRPAMTIPWTARLFGPLARGGTRCGCCGRQSRNTQACRSAFAVETGPGFSTGERGMDHLFVRRFRQHGGKDLGRRSACSGRMVVGRVCICRRIRVVVRAPDVVCDCHNFWNGHGNCFDRAGRLGADDRGGLVRAGRGAIAHAHLVAGALRRFSGSGRLGVDLQNETAGYGGHGDLPVCDFRAPQFRAGR